MKRSACVALMVLALAGCGTSSEPDFYTLAAVSGTVMPAIAVAVKVRRPVIAAYIDRPDFVRQNGDEVQIDEMTRWAEPTDRMFARILATDMQQRMPASRVMTEDMTPPDAARFVVDVDLQQFNATGFCHVALKGNVTITDKQAAPKPSTTTVPVPVAFEMNAGTSNSATVDGLSDLTAKLADRIAYLLAAQLKSSRLSD